MKGGMQHSVPIARSWLRGLATLLFVLATGLAIVDTMVWLRLERALDRRITAFTADAAQAGWSVRAHRGRRGGWPLAATLRITGLRLAADGAVWPGPLEWSGDAVELSLSPFHPGVLHVALPGTQAVRLGGMSLRGWGSGLGLDSDGSRIVLSADALHLARAGAGPDDVLQSAAVEAELHWRPRQAGGTDLAVTLHELAMPLPGAGGGRVAERARLVARLDGPLAAALPPDGAQAVDLAAMLARWARAGGRLELTEASLDWPDAGLFLSGSLSPGTNGAFDGDLALDLTRPERPLSVLRRAGVIGAGQETAMLAVIGLIGEGEPQQASEQRTRLPLQLRSGVLRMGDIPLARVLSP